MKMQGTMTAMALIAALGMSGQALAADEYGKTPAPAAGAASMPDRTTAAVGAIGKDVVNQVGQDVGEVEDIVADSSTNEIFAVISVGGFLGMGEKDVVVPLSALNVGGADVILMSQGTADSLKSSPAYDPSRYRSISMNSERGAPGGDFVTTPDRSGGDDDEPSNAAPSGEIN